MLDFLRKIWNWISGQNTTQNSITIENKNLITKKNLSTEITQEKLSFNSNTQHYKNSCDTQYSQKISYNSNTREPGKNHEFFPELNDFSDIVDDASISSQIEEAVNHPYTTLLWIVVPGFITIFSIFYLINKNPSEVFKNPLGTIDNPLDITKPSEIIKNSSKISDKIIGSQTEPDFEKFSHRLYKTIYNKQLKEWEQAAEASRKNFHDWYIELLKKLLRALPLSFLRYFCEYNNIPYTHLDRLGMNEKNKNNIIDYVIDELSRNPELLSKVIRESSIFVIKKMIYSVFLIGFLFRMFKTGLNWYTQKLIKRNIDFDFKSDHWSYGFINLHLGLGSLGITGLAQTRFFRTYPILPQYLKTWSSGKGYSRKIHWTQDKFLKMWKYLRFFK